MAEDSHRGEPSPQGGVFGNLPDARPGPRSPRRRAGKDSQTANKAATTRPKAKPRQRRTPKPQPQPSPSGGQPADAPRPEPAGRAQGQGGIEDLAWAGVAAAAEAATLGVRLASRALDALRGNSERG